MKKSHTSEAFWMIRLAPYLLVGILASLGFSLLKTVPPVWCMITGAGSGGLVLLFHTLKWRTGREGFQFAAMAAWMFPFLAIIPSALPSGFQYVGIFAAIYFTGVAILRRRIRAWMQS